MSRVHIVDSVFTQAGLQLEAEHQESLVWRFQLRFRSRTEFAVLLPLMLPHPLTVYRSAKGHLVEVAL